ncbi:MAG: hypothetical protein KBT31_00780 [Firmicutes bacterium]|nr:hypothetical protein [Candidatus Colimorpha enterica]
MKKPNLKEIALFPLYGAIMFLTAQIDIIPNVHPLAMFISVFTLIYRKKVLFPIYIYALLDGIFNGFGVWWLSNLYIWLPVAFAVSCLPLDLTPKKLTLRLSLICACHGLLFGVLYSPVYYLFVFGHNLSAALTWVLNGLPFDIIHACGNFVIAFCAVPLITLICKLDKHPLPYKNE